MSSEEVSHPPGSHRPREQETISSGFDINH